MRDYCTYFDHNYLAQGLTLYHSLRRHSRTFRLWVLCLSNICYERLAELGLPELRLISLEDFEKNDSPLLLAKQNRSLIEYYFTCTPSLPLFIFREALSVDAITYLDSDLYFFADPESVQSEIDSYSIAITPHGFPPSLRYLELYGVFNVGWMTFRRDQNGLECLNWWRERCLEWCHDRAESGRFADQKYLDDWPVRFQNVKVLDDPGINVAPWNLHVRELTLDESGVVVNGRRLIFYHFHNLKQLAPGIYNPQLTDYGVEISPILRRNVYEPYVKELDSLGRSLKITMGSSIRFNTNESVNVSMSELSRQ